MASQTRTSTNAIQVEYSVEQLPHASTSSNDAADSNLNYAIQEDPVLNYSIQEDSVLEQLPHVVIQMGSVEQLPHASMSANNATAGSNLNNAIQVDSVEQLRQQNQQFARDLLNRNWKSTGEYLELCDKYIDNTNKTVKLLVGEYLNSASNYKLLIQEGGRSFEGVNWKAPLMNISHLQLFHHLDSVHRQQLLVCNSLRSFQNDLVRELHRAKVCTKVSDVAFNAVTVIITAAHAATAKTSAEAVAAALPPLLMGMIWTWPLSLFSKYKDGLKKHVKITRLMLKKITISDWSSLHSSAKRIDLQTKSVSEMAESVDAGEARKKALMESFQELQGQATKFELKILLLDLAPHLEYSGNFSSVMFSITSM